VADRPASAAPPQFTSNDPSGLSKIQLLVSDSLHTIVLHLTSEAQADLCGYRTAQQVIDLRVLTRFEFPLTTMSEIPRLVLSPPHHSASQGSISEYVLQLKGALLTLVRSDFSSITRTVPVASLPLPLPPRLSQFTQIFLFDFYTETMRTMHTEVSRRSANMSHSRALHPRDGFNAH
jgi:hypothetical protein